MQYDAKDAPTCLEQVRLLCDRGQYLDAQALIPALSQDDSPQARVQLSRLYGHLGARRQAEAVAIRNGRRHRQSICALTNMIRMVGGRRGAYKSWTFFERGMPADGDDADRAEWLSLRGYNRALLRDFERAMADHDEAMRLNPDDAWLHVERAYSHELADQMDLALHHARRAVALRPDYRPAVQMLAQLHLTQGQDEEAIRLLRESLQGAQSAHMALALLDILMERREMQDAVALLAQAESGWPLADKDLRNWFQGRWADVRFYLGEIDQSIAHARRAQTPFFERLAARLEQRSAVQRRVELPVGFVRQNRMTCAPATLAAISHYWGKSAEHLDIAEAICYDGTPGYSERNWCETQGMLAREFTVDWDVARALLDAGVPFTLGTVATNSAHLQAVIGYDEWRGTLLIREPSQRTYNEFLAQSLFDSHRASGPRGMILIPPEQAHRLQGISLPEADLWDAYNRVMWSLSRHQREQAVCEAEAMKDQATDHRLTIQAQRAIAMYDGHDEVVLAHVNRLLEAFPFEPNLVLHKSSLLRTVGSRSQGESWWDAVMNGTGFDPILGIRYVQFLQEDTRESERVGQMLARVLQMASTDGSAWYAQAGYLWDRGERERALTCYRMASCLTEWHEHYADTYARAARALGRWEEALAFLIRRAQSTVDRNASPTLTLFNQLELAERTAEGFQHLEAAIAKRPHDPDLLLFAAEVSLRYGRQDEAGAYLRRAEPFAKRATWLRQQAQYHRERGDNAQALELARQAAELEPLNVATHRTVAALLSQTQSRADALRYLQGVAAAHAHHFELQRLLLNHLAEDELDEAVTLLTHMRELSPIDVWTHRELAFRLGRAHRLDEALESAQAALALDPQGSRTHSTMGYVRWRQGQLPEARQHMRDALVLSVDNDYALGSLVDMALNREERLAALQVIREELIRQVTMGDSLLAYQEMARGTLAEDELLAVMQDALAHREDLWQAWAGTAMQLARMNRFEEAHALFDKAIARFPLLPRLLLEKARTWLLQGERAQARQSFAGALALSPGWPQAVRGFADAVGDEGVDLERALPVLASGLQRYPDNADLRALRGWFMWRLERQDEALADLRAATEMDPQLRWPWDALQRVAQLYGQADLAAKVAEAVAQRRPGDAIAWLRLAEFAQEPARALEATERGLALEPRHQGLYDARLRLLMKADRLDDVRQALDKSPWGQTMPAQIAVYKARLQKLGGSLNHAIDTLRLLIEQDRDSYLLWRELADWSDEAGRLVAYVEAARELVRIAPGTAMSHGYLGHALRRTRAFDEAIAAFDRAIALDPSYAFASMQLVDICLERGYHDQAGEVLNMIERHDSSALVALRRLRWARALKQRALAIEKAAFIVSQPNLQDALYEDALTVIRQAGWSVYLLDDIERAVEKGFCAQQALQLWLEHQGGGWLPGSFYRDVRKLLSKDVGHVLKRAVLFWLGDHNERRLLDRFVREHRDILQTDPICWASVAYAYVNQSRFAAVTDWMADWRKREQAPLWALNNLNLSLRQLKRFDEARAVTQRVLASDAANVTALLWHAVDAAHAREHTQLQGLMGKLQSIELLPYYSQLRQMLSAYEVAVRKGDSGMAVPHFKTLRVQVGKDRVLKSLLGLFQRRLLRWHTPLWVQPWRWVQFRLG